MNRKKVHERKIKQSSKITTHKVLCKLCSCIQFYFTPHRSASVFNFFSFLSLLFFTTSLQQTKFQHWKLFEDTSIFISINCMHLNYLMNTSAMLYNFIIVYCEYYHHQFNFLFIYFIYYALYMWEHYCITGAATYFYFSISFSLRFLLIIICFLLNIFLLAHPFLC